jgi:S1-C subfamily serine protease
LVWITAALLLTALAAGGIYLAYRARAPDAVDPFIEYPRTAQIFSGSTVISRGVFTPRGYVLAMAHSVPDPSKLSVGWVEGGRTKRTAAKVVKRGLVTDEVLLLQLEDPPDRSLPFPTRIAATLQPNERVERYLAPNDRAPGKVKKVFAEMEVHTGKRPVRLSRLLLTTMISGPGDSGAPVVDAKGQVVGLVYGASQNETISLMIEDVKISFPEAF